MGKNEIYLLIKIVHYSVIVAEKIKAIPGGYLQQVLNVFAILKYSIFLTVSL